MKRVLHVMSSIERSGMETMLLCSAGEWARHGLSCDVLATAPQPGPIADTMRASGYGFIHLPFRSRRVHYLPSMSFLWKFYKLCTAYDIVHLHVESGTPMYTVLARLAGVKNIVRSVHNTFLFDGLLRARKRFSRRLCRALGVRYGMVSDSVSRCEMERFDNSGVRTWNWLDVSYFRPPTVEEREAARTHFGYGAEQFVIVSAANCNAAKNHTALIRALVDVTRELKPLYVHIGREEPGRPEVALASALGLEGATQFVGSQADPRSYFWAADAYVMPSTYEGLGVAALEAIASGTPAVLTDVSGLCEILAATQYTVSVGPTPESIAQGLLALAARPMEQRKREALEDSDRIRGLFSAARGVDIMVRDLYRVDASSAPLGSAVSQ